MNKMADMRKPDRGEQTTFPRGVPKPALRALAAAGYTHIDQLARVPEKHLATLHGMGPKALGVLKAALKERGKDFKS